MATGSLPDPCQGGKENPDSAPPPPDYLRASILLEHPERGLLAAKDTYPPWIWDVGTKGALDAIVGDLRRQIERQIERRGRS